MEAYSHKLIDLKAWVKVITIYTEFSIFGNISPIYRCILLFSILSFQTFTHVKVTITTEVISMRQNSGQLKALCVSKFVLMLIPFFNTCVP